MEIMNHLMVDCPFSHFMWHEVLSWIRSTAAPPTVGVLFADWWHATVNTAPSSARKGTASIIMLTAWWIWKHRNAAVFDNVTPSIAPLTGSIPQTPGCGLGLGRLGLERYSCRSLVPRGLALYFLCMLPSWACKLLFLS
ncbi:hypothetical protein BRADI_1g60552v3 [Brachypodium distachyon]|uniref:Reverse transcriptase zinc-binding domain-containing protein n=1 Tax=Brachypodium distachyon TaxID=15368 RepID=A0A0Q3HF94_BRADI|nr:hypothetical protein BRADI_1g60552v3 [Brachypodium distachyon]